MNTGVFKPEGHPYPGIFIRGEDALKWAEALRLIKNGDTAEIARRASLGSYAPLSQLIDIFESCRV